MQCKLQYDTIIKCNANCNTIQYNTIQYNTFCCDVIPELEKLEQGHAIGDFTHRFMMREEITEFRNTTVFSYLVLLHNKITHNGDNLQI